MLQNPEHSEQPKPKEIIFDQYGLYIVTDKSAEHFNPNNSELLDNPNNTVLVSQPDWQSTLDVLSILILEEQPCLLQN